MEASCKKTLKAGLLPAFYIIAILLFVKDRFKHYDPWPLYLIRLNAKKGPTIQ
jgi:hypothetical protein